MAPQLRPVGPDGHQTRCHFPSVDDPILFSAGVGPDGADVTDLRRALAAPCFAEDPQELIELGICAEEAGFEGFFLWDHLVFTDDGDGHPSWIHGWCWQYSSPAPAPSGWAR
ncbi:hypothetical protein ACVBEQ_25055 [Nakamurella sp. GG22]